MTETNIIPDTKFKNFMDQEAMPFLQSIFQSGYVPVNDAKGSLYYEFYRPSSAIGAIVISHGFSESVEKYKEVIFYFARAGYQVYLADHRGHGRSLRDTEHPNMIHIIDFSDYVRDLHAFICNIVKPSSNGLPLYLFAHSMGGAIGALYLETYPTVFQKAILTAPMLAISMGAVPTPCARALGRIMVSLHHEETYAPGQHAFQPGEKFEDSCSSCPERFHYYQEKKEANPLFQTCGSSYGWVYQSLCACHTITQKRNCKKIKVPVLVFQSVCDSTIKPSGILRFVQNTSNARLISIFGSRHEIYNSPASVLTCYYQEIFEFLK